MSLSVFVILIPLLVLVVLVWFLSQTKKLVLSVSLSKTIPIAYFVILVASTIAIYALPDNSFVHKPENRQSLQSSWDLIEIAKEGTLDQQTGIIQNASRHDVIEGSSLVIHAAPDFNEEIFIVRKESTDRTIEVYSFVTPHLVQDADVTRQVLAPMIDFEKNTLILRPAAKYELAFISFHLDFTAAQFSGSTTGAYENSTVIGRQVIYLKAPKTLEILTDYQNIVYI
jgi:hypothetical protein